MLEKIATKKTDNVNPMADTPLLSSLDLPRCYGGSGNAVYSNYHAR